MRHKFLTRLIGTKPEEDKSLEAVTHLIIVVSSVTAAASVLEVLFYFIWNRFVCILIFNIYITFVYKFITFSVILGSKSSKGKGTILQ